MAFYKPATVTTSLAVLATAALVTVISLRGGTSSATYLDYKRDVVTCTATGGIAKYPFCNWQEPVNDAGSGSTVVGLYFTEGKMGKSIGLDFTIGASATASGGTTILNNIQTGSGFVAYQFTGSYLVNSGSYLRAVSLTPSPSLQETATMEVEYYTRLSK